MSKTLRNSLLCFVALALIVGGIAQGRGDKVDPAKVDRVMKAVTSYYGPAAAASKLYVGSEVCLACHPRQEGWRNSLHATGLKMVPYDGYSMQARKGIIFDYNKNGVDDFKDALDFNQIGSAFDRYKPNAPVLRYDPAKPNPYIVRIGQVDFPVIMAHGGSGIYKQRVVVRIPVTDTQDKLSKGVYEAPIQFNETTMQYVVYNPQYWYKADNSPVITPSSTSKDAAASNSFHKGCAGCHTTAVAVWKDANGEYLSTAPPAVLYTDYDFHYLDLNFDGIVEQYNTGCERCHGPGGAHVIGRGDKEAIVNPLKLTAKQANELCGACHSRGTSAPTGIHEYPYDETAKEDFGPYVGAELVGSRFWIEKPGLWPDQFESRQHHQQFHDFKRSSKWEYANHKVTCYECHDVHADTKAQVREVMEVDSGGKNLKIPVQVNDNSLCLSCHAGFGPFDTLKRDDILDLKANGAKIGQVVQAHSHHSYSPATGIGTSRCTLCHMAHVAASGAPYDISTHTFQVVPPQKTLATQAQGGMPNSCAVSCHRQFTSDANLGVWNEPSDVTLAEFLKLYYGPEGRWWKTQ